MNTRDFFQYQPRLKAYEVHPSKDHATESNIILVENGACLGISTAEKNLLDLFDGNNTLGEIVCRINAEAIAPFTTLRTLLWDLHRYGFLEESPWGTKDSGAYGYWGVSSPFWKSFSIKLNLGGIETIIGRMMSWPMYPLVMLGIVVYLMWGSNNVLVDVLQFSLYGSVASAGLMVVLGVIAGPLLTELLLAFALKGVHQGPVGFALDYRYGLPLLRLDARRLRSLPVREALSAILSPVITVFFVGAVLLSLSKSNTPPNFTFYLAVGMMISVFFMLAPWYSSVLSREISLRLRGGPALPLMMNSVFEVLRSFTTVTVNPFYYRRVFLLWGVWSLLYLAFVFQIILHVLQWDVIETGYAVLREERRMTVFLLFCIVAVGASVLVASALAFVVWLGIEIIREIKSRHWPQHDFALAGLLVLVASLLLLPYLAMANFSDELNLEVCVFMSAIVLLVTVLLSWHKEGRGLECRVHIPVFLLVGALAIKGFGGLPLATEGGLINDAEAGQSPEAVIQTASQVVLLIAALGFWVYQLVLYGHWFRPMRGSYLSLWSRLLLSTGAIGGMLLLWLETPFEAGLWGISFNALCVFFLAHAILEFFWIGSSRNGSLPIMNLSMAVACLGSGLSLPENHWLQTEHFFIASLVMILCAYLLRASAMQKTALGYSSKRRNLALVSKNGNDLGNELSQSTKELYCLNPAPGLLNDIKPETLRQAIRHLHRLTGTEALRAIARGTSWKLPWRDTQLLSSVLPVSISFPPLTSWNRERIISKLRHVPTFALLENEELYALQAVGRFVVYYPGDTLIHQGEVEGDLYVILDGWVRVENEHPIGHTTLALLGPNDFVGEIGFLSGEERTASVRALHPVLALRFHRQDITPEMRETFATIQTAKRGESWQQLLKEANLFSEFLPSLNARVFLESRRVLLDRGQTLWLDREDCKNKVAVFLSGEGHIIIDDKRVELSEGQVWGLEQCFGEQSLSGQLHSVRPSRLLLVDQYLMLEAITELLTPKEIFKIPHHHATTNPALVKGRFRFS